MCQSENIIVSVRKSYGDMWCVYYCSNEKYEKYKDSNFLLNLCGYYLTNTVDEEYKTLLN